MSPGDRNLTKEGVMRRRKKKKTLAERLMWLPFVGGGVGMSLPAYLAGIEPEGSPASGLWMIYSVMFLTGFAAFAGTPEFRSLPFAHWFKDGFERPFRTTVLWAGVACLLSIVAVWLATLPIPLWLHILPAGALAMGLMRILVMEMARSDRDRDLY